MFEIDAQHITSEYLNPSDYLFCQTFATQLIHTLVPHLTEFVANIDGEIISS
jgi:hypothetical protein